MLTSHVSANGSQTTEALINSNLDDSVLVFASHEEDVPFHPGCCMELADYSIGKRMENAS